MKTLIVFGWTGASFKDICDKTKLIRPLFSKVIIIETPVHKLLFDFKYNFMKEKIKNLKETIDSQNVILYYSGGGSFYHPFVHKELDHLVTNYIFDSAPVPFGISHFMKWSFRKHNPIISILMFIPLTLYMYTVGLFRITYYNNYILNNPIKKGLLLTGTNDPLVPLDFVNKHLFKVFTSVQLFDSGHLEHDIKHSSKYLEEISNFIK